MLPNKHSRYSIHFIDAAGAFVLLLVFTPASFSQSKPPVRALADLDRPVNFQTEECKLAARAISVLKRLEKLVLNYESLGEFETNRKLARVSLEEFTKELENVTKEVEFVLNRLPDSKLKVQIANTLYSYRDGAYWWNRAHQPRIINAASFLSVEATTTLSDLAFASSIPYTITIHWRQARKYMKRAQGLISSERVACPLQVPNSMP